MERIIVIIRLSLLEFTIREYYYWRVLLLESINRVLLLDSINRALLESSIIPIPNFHKLNAAPYYARSACRNPICLVIIF